MKQLQALKACTGAEVQAFRPYQAKQALWAIKLERACNVYHLSLWGQLSLLALQPAGADRRLVHSFAVWAWWPDADSWPSMRKKIGATMWRILVSYPS